MTTTQTTDLTPFRTARTLRWHPHTVFVRSRGADGSLIADDATSLPLDIYSPDELTNGVTPPISGGVGIVVYRPMDVEDAQAAIRGWCREQLGRDDVEFGPWEVSTP